MKGIIVSYKLNNFIEGFYEIVFNDFEMCLKNKKNEYKIEFDMIKFVQKRKYIGNIVYLIFLKDGKIMKLLTKKERVLSGILNNKIKEIDKNLFDYD